MAKFYAWDPVNEDESKALELEAVDAYSAAVGYAEQDVDGGIDGLYTGKDGGSVFNVAENGHPVHVRGEDGVVTRWHVGVVEAEPLFDAVKVELKE
jgi:hypothetical protein